MTLQQKCGLTEKALCLFHEDKPGTFHIDEEDQGPSCHTNQQREQLIPNRKDDITVVVNVLFCGTSSCCCCASRSVTNAAKDVLKLVFVAFR
jgi:hypothetical protein